MGAPDNVVSVFLQAVEKWPMRTMLSHKSNDQWKQINYLEAREMFYKLAQVLLNLKFSGKRVMVISDTVWQWLLCDLACLAVKAVDVPRGLSTSALEMQTIMNHAGIGAVIIQNETAYEKIPAKFRKLPIISIQRFRSSSRRMIFFDDIIKIKKYDKNRINASVESIKTSDLATIIYTSGTTGNPKGVMLTHANFMHNIRTLVEVLELSQETYLSLLPIWHVYERTCEYLCMSVGTSFFYSHKRTFKDDLSYIKPTIMPSAPAVWISVYNAVMGKISKNPFPRKKLALFLINQAVRHVKARRILCGAVVRNPDNDKNPKNIFIHRIIYLFTWAFFHLAHILVFKSIIKFTGGKLEKAVSGGGALPDFIDDFYEACGLPLLNGYGLTETAPVISVRTTACNIRGTIGPVLPECSVQIRHVESGKCLQPGQKGYICVKGPNVMKGYYKNPQATKKVLGRDGYFNTEDLGFIDQNGMLVITGRAKETIVLSSGENIEPSIIENELLRAPGILQCAVVGNDQKVPAALIVPDPDYVSDLAKKNNLSFLSYGELLSHALIRSHYRGNIKKFVNANERKIQYYEHIGHFILLENPFTEGDELTNKLSLRRHVIEEKYKKIITEMYKVKTA